MMSQLAQREKKANEEESDALIALFDELLANGREELALLRQHRTVAQQNNILNYKREYLVELLQTMHTMRQEDVWEKVGGKEKYPHEFVIIGVRYICFDFTKHKLHYPRVAQRGYNQKIIFHQLA